MLSFAVAGSKLVGTGLENEHIEQIHVALMGWLEGAGFLGWSCSRLPAEGASLTAFGIKVILGEDFIKPASHNVSALDDLQLSEIMETYEKLASLDVPQVHSHGSSPWLLMIHITSTMACQICVTILMVCEFRLARIEADRILDEEKCFIGK